MPKTSSYVKHRVFVEVLGQELWVAEDSTGELYFPVRPTCTILDIDSGKALERIKGDSRLYPGLHEIYLPTAGGTQPFQCLASTEYAWWLSLYDPRRMREEIREGFLERQRILMSLAKEIMLKSRQLLRLPEQRGERIQRHGQVEGHFRCLRCNAPHHFCIDEAGWHLELGVEVD